MKTFLVIIITATVTWIAISAIEGIRASAQRLWLISAVKAPGRMALNEIQEDMNAGRYGLAQGKINALVDAWKRFEPGSDSFRGPGIGDIMVTFSKLETNSISASPVQGGTTNRNHQ